MRTCEYENHGHSGYKPSCRLVQITILICIIATNSIIVDAYNIIVIILAQIKMQTVNLCIVLANSQFTIMNQQKLTNTN